MAEFKEYIEVRNNVLTIEEYLYITNYIELISSIKYTQNSNIFKITTNDNNCFEINIKQNNKIKKKN